jgi:hypothetical protein
LNSARGGGLVDGVDGHVNDDDEKENNVTTPESA